LGLDRPVLEVLLGMVIIRLSRAGAKKRPFYRIVVMDSRKARQSRPLEFLGSYDPCPNPERIRIEADKMQKWIEKGAQLSPTVRSLVRRLSRQQPAPAAAEPVAEGAS
jgi:small subunit ribosomal protein S16